MEVNFIYYKSKVISKYRPVMTMILKSNLTGGEEIETEIVIVTEIEMIMTGEEEVEVEEEEEEGRWSEHSVGEMRKRKMIMRNLASQVSNLACSHCLSVYDQLIRTTET